MTKFVTQLSTATIYILNADHMRNWVRVKVMVFNTTFNNISVISCRSILLVEETRGPGENSVAGQINTILIQKHLFWSVITTLQHTVAPPVITT